MAIILVYTRRQLIVGHSSSCCRSWSRTCRNLNRHVILVDDRPPFRRSMITQAVASGYPQSRLTLFFHRYLTSIPHCVACVGTPLQHIAVLWDVIRCSSVRWVVKVRIPKASPGGPPRQDLVTHVFDFGFFCLLSLPPPHSSPPHVAHRDHGSRGPDRPVDRSDQGYQAAYRSGTRSHTRRDSSSSAYATPEGFDSPEQEMGTELPARGLVAACQSRSHRSPAAHHIHR